jgi:hypothetical protein
MKVRLCGPCEMVTLNAGPGGDNQTLGDLDLFSQRAVRIVFRMAESMGRNALGHYERASVARKPDPEVLAFVADHNHTLVTHDF